jgi:hypothetical protein
LVIIIKYPEKEKLNGSRVILVFLLFLNIKENIRGPFGVEENNINKLKLDVSKKKLIKSVTAPAQRTNRIRK